MKKYYSDEDVKIAKDTNMLDFFSTRYGFTFKKQGGEYRCIEHNSLVVKNDLKRWFWNSKGVGGTNAVTYLIKVENMHFYNAINTIIDGKAFTAICGKAPNLPIKPKEVLTLPDKALFPYAKVLDYLCDNRKIDKHVVLDLIKQNIIYQDIKGNVVFVGYDETNTPRFACVRSTQNSQFRIDCKGSDKRYSFYLEGLNQKNLYVFEAPIDALSHATLRNIYFNDKFAWKRDSRLSLGGTSTVALDAYLERNRSVKRLILCLDNDDAGVKAIGLIKAKYADIGIEIVVSLPKAKDFNLELVELIISRNMAQKSKIKVDSLVMV